MKVNFGMGFVDKKIIIKTNHYTIYDLNNYSHEELIEQGYYQFTPEKIYNYLYVNYPDCAGC